MPEIQVSRSDVEESRSRFHVQVVDDDGVTSHDVTLSRADLERLGARYPTSEAFIEACFTFLLEREPKGSILPSFDVSQISTYFPEFDTVIARH
ncbi:MAG: hypothetical protein ACHQDE_01325 [Acidimicrobiia bacterium]